MIGYSDAEFYIQLEPRWSNYIQYDGTRTLLGIKVGAVTSNRPRKPRGGAVTTKLTLRVPDSVFQPLRPEAVVVIPESMTVATPITVEALDPNQDAE